MLVTHTTSTTHAVMHQYELQVWFKHMRRYVATWRGPSLERARIMSRKPYNNRDWMGRRRIVEISVRVVSEVLGG